VTVVTPLFYNPYPSQFIAFSQSSNPKNQGARFQSEKPNTYS